MDASTAQQARERGGVLLRAGLRPALVQRRVAAGEIVETGRRTLVASSTPESWDQRLFVVQSEIGEPMCFTGLAGLHVYGVAPRLRSRLSSARWCRAGGTHSTFPACASSALGPPIWSG
ncbi:MAG TPA: hypothetical protein VNB94_06250 [Mycobacteriales bacterium]|nr:hypothetical protein [Mycobacteriales bacterium]